MTATEKEDVLRNLGNFCKVPMWNAMMTKDQVNYLFQEHSDFIFCNGHGRTIKAIPLTNETFKVFTVPL